MVQIVLVLAVQYYDPFWTAILCHIASVFMANLDLLLLIRMSLVRTKSLYHFRHKRCLWHSDTSFCESSFKPTKGEPGAPKDKENKGPLYFFLLSIFFFMNLSRTERRDFQYSWIWNVNNGEISCPTSSSCFRYLWFSYSSYQFHLLATRNRYANKWYNTEEKLFIIASILAHFSLF